MKAIDAQALQSILDGELVWRRKEISSLVSVSKSMPDADQRALIRAAVPLLYAHWEAFGKECGVRYLEFVSYKRLTFKLLKPSFQYLRISPIAGEIARAEVAAGIEKLLLIAKAFDETNKDTFKRRINTRSNLRFDVLSEILTLCGLDPSVFDSYRKFIDEELCDARNEIAHGRSTSPSWTAFVAKRDQAFVLMTQLQTEIVNAALNGAYKG